VVAGSPDITYDYYYNESWQVLEVRKGGDTDPLEQYVWGIQYVDAPVVRFRDGNVDGDLLDTQDNTDSTLYYTYDGNFNVTALVKTDGTVAERYTYDPYGKVAFKAANWSDAANQAKSAYDNEILYCGYRFDPESGLYHVRRRPLHPTLGRWLTRDPIGYGDGMNRYQYAGGGPIGWVDPYGLRAATWVERQWWLSWFSHPLPRKLLNNYMDDTGKAITLTEDEMAATDSIVTLRRSQLFMEKVAELKAKGGGKAHVSLTGGAQALLNGTLANFNIFYIGNVCVKPDGSWQFVGTMRWHDVYDFDPKPFGSASRSIPGEVKVRVADAFLPGMGFAVDSPVVSVSQKDTDKVATWGDGGGDGGSAGANRSVMAPAADIVVGNDVGDVGAGDVEDIRTDSYHPNIIAGPMRPPPTQ